MIFPVILANYTVWWNVTQNISTKCLLTNWTTSLWLFMTLSRWLLPNDMECERVCLCVIWKSMISSLCSIDHGQWYEDEVSVYVFHVKNEMIHIDEAIFFCGWLYQNVVTLSVIGNEGCSQCNILRKWYWYITKPYILAW